MTSYLKLSEEQRNNDSLLGMSFPSLYSISLDFSLIILGNVEWYQSLLYLMEGALGFRKF